SFVLKWLSAGGVIRIPFILFPLLTVKPPMTFFVFVILTLFVKRRERRFIKQGGSYEDYQLFLQTNRNSLSFSVHATIVLFIAGLLDLILFVLLPSFQLIAAQSAAMDVMMVEGGLNSAEALEVVNGIDMDMAVYSFMSRLYAIGVGGAYSLILIAPLMLLFSYTRKRNNPVVDSLIPVVAIVLILLVYLQSFYQIMHVLPISGKINFQEVMDTFDSALDMIPEMLTAQ
ncbi:MAG: hypothetical protein IJR16_04610, partial [Spirochaetales bacterium]|nr:hypothetical protein [Spirochaetales bacterium]